MRYEDRISIATPEGVEVDLTLAGVGSRFTAALIDGLIQGAVIVALGMLGGLLASGADAADFDGGLAAGIALALVITSVLLVLLGYPIAFETWASGRTPGKRWTGLRVVRVGGAPVGFLTSSVRNLLRLVDYLPSFYAVGIVAMLASSRNQRLGDMAAGTLVVQEPTRAKASVEPPSTPSPAEVPATSDWAAWDLSAVSAEDLGTVRRFLERRDQLSPQARAHLAQELAGRLRPKVSGPPQELHPEAFLAEVAAAKSARG